ncbi:hypothetical protein GCM10010434_086790 [Winogradskya humida]
MTGEQIRAYAPGGEEPEQRHLDREQGGLGHPGLVQRPGVVAGQRRAYLGSERVEDLVQRLREHREAAPQLAAHAEPLRSLAREQEGHPAGLACRSADHGAGRPARGHRGQGFHQLGPVLGHDHRAVFQRRAGRRERVTHVGERSAPGERDQPLGLVTQRVPVAGRQHPRRRPAVLRLEDRSRLRVARLFEDDVRVRTTESEGGDASPPRAFHGRPVPLAGEQFHRTGHPVHMRRRLRDVQRRGQGAGPHGQHHLDDTGDTRGGLGVADVRLHRAQQQRTVGGPVQSVRRQQGLSLDRVAEGGAGAVRLDRVHIGGFEA